MLLNLRGLCVCFTNASRKWLCLHCKCIMIHFYITICGVKMGFHLPCQDPRKANRQCTFLGAPLSLRIRWSVSFLFFTLISEAEACWTAFLAGFFAVAYLTGSWDLNDSINSPEKQASLVSLLFLIWKSAEDAHSHSLLYCIMFQSAASIMKSN